MKGTPIVQSLRQMRRTVPSLTLPTFQRGLVWTEAQVLHLLDSAEKGFPLGQVLIWEHYGSNGRKQYVVDGQQRLTALTGIRPGDSEPTWDIQYDLDRHEWCIGQRENSIPLWVNNTMELLELTKRLSDEQSREYCNKIDKIQDCLALPAYLVENATAKEVADIFYRAATAGTPIAPDVLERALELMLQED